MNFFKELNEQGNGIIRDWISELAEGLLMGLIVLSALFIPLMLQAQEIPAQDLRIHPVDAREGFIDCAADSGPVCDLPEAVDAQLQRDIKRALVIAIYGEPGQKL